MIDRSVIIVAGGKGLRMGSQMPKQVIPIADKPILMYSIDAFFAFDPEIHIVLVLPLSHQPYWAALCAEYAFTTPHTLVVGGETRFDSVKNGLTSVRHGIVAIHDGVRPFASKTMIARCFENAQHHKAVIPVIDATDSLREMMDTGGSKIVNRSKIRLVQTPQVFDVATLKEAYHSTYNETFTDDASVVESIGVPVHLIAGEVTNIKITTPLDLQIGELIASSLNK